MGTYETCYLARAYNRLLAELKDKDRALAQQNERLSQMSKMDFLTQISTRMELENYLLGLLERCRGSKASFSIVMLDIDHFKQFNDTYGHPAGDEALKLVARKLKASVPSGRGMVARLGGEEFVTVLLEADEEETRAYAETLLMTIRTTKMILNRTQAVNVTASMGGYVYTGGNETMRDIYKRADKALYHAKDSGRARYVSYNERHRW